MIEELDRFLAHFARRNDPDNDQTNEIEALLAELRNAPLDRETVVELNTQIDQADDIGPAVAALFLRNAALHAVIGEQDAPFNVPTQTRLRAIARLHRTQGTRDMHWVLLSLLEALGGPVNRHISRAVVEALEEFSWRNCGDATHLMMIAYTMSVVVGFQRSELLARRMERYLRDPKGVERLLLDSRFRALVPNSPESLRGLLVRTSSEPVRYVIDRGYRELWERATLPTCPA